MATYIKINFSELSSSIYWSLPETIDEYPKCKNIAERNNLANILDEIKVLIQNYKSQTFEQTPMQKLGLACFDLVIATKSGRFNTPEAADNFLSGKMLGIVSLLQKTKKYLQNI